MTEAHTTTRNRNGPSRTVQASPRNNQSTTRDEDFSNVGTAAEKNNDASNSGNNPNPVKRMSITLPSNVADMLEFLAQSQGISQNEALRKAIATETYFRQQIQEGANVLIRKPGEEVKEIVFL